MCTKPVNSDAHPLSHPPGVGRAPLAFRSCVLAPQEMPQTLTRCPTLCCAGVFDVCVAAQLPKSSHTPCACTGWMVQRSRGSLSWAPSSPPPPLKLHHTSEVLLLLFPESYTLTCTQT